MGAKGYIGSKLPEKIFELLEEKPCTEEDVFGFKEKAKETAESINLFNSPFVYAICGKWGAGKTSFLTMLVKELRTISNNNLILYYNAWKASIHENPLMSLVYEIKNQLENHKEIKKLFKKGKNKSQFKTVLSSFIDSGIKLASSSVPGGQILEILKDTYDDIRNDEVENILYAEKALRVDFEKLCQLLTEVNITPILIIDDLDRCPPEQVVKTIEMLKMIFSDTDKLEQCITCENIEGFNKCKKCEKENKNTVPFKYILSVDEDYLTKAIKSKYGLPDKDSYEYIGKFIQYKKHLTITDWKPLINKVVEKINSNEKTIQILHHTPANNINFENLFPNLKGNSTLDDLSQVLLDFHVKTPRQARQILSYIISWQIDYHKVYNQPEKDIINIEKNYDLDKIANKINYDYFVKQTTRIYNIYFAIIACIKVLYTPQEVEWVLIRKLINKFPNVRHTKVLENKKESPLQFFNGNFSVIGSEISNGRGGVRGDVEILKVELQSCLVMANSIIDELLKIWQQTNDVDEDKLREFLQKELSGVTI